MEATLAGDLEEETAEKIRATEIGWETWQKLNEYDEAFGPEAQLAHVARRFVEHVPRIRALRGGGRDVTKLQADRLPDLDVMVAQVLDALATAVHSRDRAGLRSAQLWARDYLDGATGNDLAPRKTSSSATVLPDRSRALKSLLSMARKALVHIVTLPTEVAGRPLEHEVGRSAVRHAVRILAIRCRELGLGVAPDGQHSMEAWIATKIADAVDPKVLLGPRAEKLLVRRALVLFGIVADAEAARNWMKAPEMAQSRRRRAGKTSGNK